VLLSSKYDESLANVNRKLEDLSTALQTLLTQNNKLSTNTGSVKPANEASEAPHQVPNDGFSQPDAEGEVPYEGESSFVAHSRHITESLGFALASPAAISSDSTPSLDQNMIQKLLQDVAAAQSPAQDPPIQHPSTQYPELANLTLPPTSLVLKLLKHTKTGMSRWFVEFHLMKFEDFSALCQKIYFPTEDYSIYNWIVVNGGLFNLFRDVDGDLHVKLGIDKAEMNRQTELCRKNVDTAVHCLKICIDPSLEACQALSVGAALAMESGKVSTAWRLTSTASRMCLDLGLHRLPSGEDGDLPRKRITFWYVYSMDKGLSFNFGRTPTIHDYDITVDRPTWPTDVEESWAPLYQGMLEFSILQGDIYEQLFSVSAVRQPTDIRVARARAFAQKLKALKAPMVEVLEQKDLPWRDVAKFSVLTSEMFIDWSVGCHLASPLILS
jgi:hypothetical protein